MVADAREAHDRGIKVAMAALCAQIEIPPADKVAFLYQVEDAELPTQFLKAYPRMQLHEFAGGLRLRPWKEYGDPAFTGLWAQTLQSSMIPLRRGSTSMMPAFPAVERIIVDAEAIRRGEATGKGQSRGRWRAR